MTAGHTPGPWAINPDTLTYRGNSIRIERIDPKAGILASIADVFAPNGAGDRWIEEGRANARLIASAPALLEALEALWAVALNFDARDAYNGEASWDDAVDNAHTVIMQARGEK